MNIENRQFIDPGDGRVFSKYLGNPPENYYVYLVIFKDKEKSQYRAWREVKNMREMQEQFLISVEKYEILHKPPIPFHYWGLSRLMLTLA